MRYALDSNFSLKWVLIETDSDKARRLRAEFEQQIHDLLAPDVFPVEVAHGLAKAERRGVIPRDQDQAHPQKGLEAEPVALQPSSACIT
jgi:predicted nucleic acid-binding protein